MTFYRYLLCLCCLLGGNIGHAVNYFWIGGSGNWSDLTHWATSSGGGQIHDALPGPNDRVIFDANSFTGLNQSVFIDIPDAQCGGMNWEGALYEPSLDGLDENNLQIFGSFNLIREMQLNFRGEYQFLGETPGQTISLAGHMIPRYARFNAEMGEWILQDSFQVYLTINFDRGTLNTNGQWVQSQHFYSNSRQARQLILGNSTVELVSRRDTSLEKPPSLEILQDGIEMDAGTSTIHFSGKEEAFLFGNGPSALRFHNIQFDGASSTILFRNPRNRVDSLLFNGSAQIRGTTTYGFVRFAPGFTYTFAQNELYIIEALEANGSCDLPININTSIEDDPVKVEISSDLVLNYVAVNGIQQIGIGRLIANNSIDLGSNENWIFNEVDARQLYWVGGAGLWEDPAHWSLSSGGPGGECMPRAIDDVFFDANSFSMPRQLVGSDLSLRANCRNMEWQDVPNEVGLENIALNVFGNLVFEPSMQLNMLDTEMRGTGNLKLESGNNPFQNGISFKAPMASYQVNGNLKLGGPFLLFRGQLFSNGADIDASWLFHGDEFADLDLSGSYIRLFQNWGDGYAVRWYNLLDEPNLRNTDFTIELMAPDARAQFFLEYPMGNVIFSDSEGRGQLFSENAQFNKVIFMGDGDLHMSDNRFDTLIMSAGKSYEVEAGRQQIINQYWKVLGNPCDSIDLFAQGVGKALVSMPAEANLLADFINMEDMSASGGNEFRAGANSLDINNSNEGWIFEEASDSSILGPDRILCQNNAILLDITQVNPNTEYLWEDGSTSPLRSIKQAGTYQLQLTFDGSCVVQDTIQIEDAENVDLDLPMDTLLCQGDSINLDVSLGGEEVLYTWSDGNNQAKRVIRTAGQYWVEVQVEACSWRDSFSLALKPVPDIELEVDRVDACEGDTLELRLINKNNAQFFWFDGSVENTVQVTESGNYWVEASLDNCNRFLTENFFFQEKPEWELNGDTILACREQLPFLQAYREGTYLWQGQNTAPSYLVEESGWYSLAIDDGLCKSLDSVFVSIRDCERVNVYLPNAFSPNKDNINDYFQCFLDPEYTINAFEITVFDRWGGKVFFSEDPNFQWDGEHRNQLVEKGPYFYRLNIQFTDEFGDREAQLNGTFLLLR